MSKTSIFKPALLKRLTTFSQKQELIQPNQTIIIGLSGGPDSLFLLYLLAQFQKEYNLTLIAAHLDHEWRAESARDALFCKKVSEKLDIPFISKKASEIKLSKKTGSLEEKGRLLRRAFFNEIVKSLECLNHSNPSIHFATRVRSQNTQDERGNKFIQDDFREHVNNKVLEQKPLVLSESLLRFVSKDSSDESKSARGECFGTPKCIEPFERSNSSEKNITIALGHHADDQQETFFIRLLRGAGLSGLTGIKPRDGLYIHPLLCCTKQEIIETLENNNIDFLIDPTNQSDQFLRNRIRMQVIPALRECDERFDESLVRIMQNLQEADDFLMQETKNYFAQITTISEKKIWLDYTKLLSLHPFLQKQLLLHWLINEKAMFTPSAALFDEILRFLHATKSKEHTFYNSWRIVKKGSQATIV